MRRKVPVYSSCPAKMYAKKTTTTEPDMKASPPLLRSLSRLATSVTIFGPAAIARMISFRSYPCIMARGTASATAIQSTGRVGKRR